MGTVVRVGRLVASAAAAAQDWGTRTGSVAPRLMKIVPVVTACLVVVALSACGGQTTNATNIAPTSATLNATAHCDTGQICTWYWEYWPASGPRSASLKTAVVGPVKGAS